MTTEMGSRVETLEERTLKSQIRKLEGELAASRSAARKEEKMWTDARTAKGLLRERGQEDDFFNLHQPKASKTREILAIASAPTTDEAMAVLIRKIWAPVRARERELALALKRLEQVLPKVLPTPSVEEILREREDKGAISPPTAAVSPVDAFFEEMAALAVASPDPDPGNKDAKQ